MKRPTGWPANPQAMAAVSKRRENGGHSALTHESDGDTWLTPRYILGELGGFDLDPCATELNPHWVCERSFTRDDDGLHARWVGRVFMNPPFSNTVPWLRRHARYGDGISLVPASIESVIWRDAVWPRAKAILLLHGRTRFCNPDGSTTTGRPLRSVALIAWGDEDQNILRGSALAGVLLEDWRQK